MKKETKNNKTVNFDDKRRALYKKWWVWASVIAGLVVVVLLARYYTSAGNKFKISNTVIKYNEGITMIYGEIKNTDRKAHSANLRVDLYSTGKKNAGSLNTTVYDLNGGETKVFYAMVSEDYSKIQDYKISIASIISTSDNKKSFAEFTNVVVKDNPPAVSGYTRNNDSNKHTYTYIVGMYDKDNKLMGAAVGKQNEVEAGENRFFVTTVPQDLTKAVTLKPYVDRVIQ